MKTLVLAIVVSIAIPACTTPPPVSGTLSHKLGMLTLDPQGRVIITVEPKSGK